MNPPDRTKSRVSEDHSGSRGAKRKREDAHEVGNNELIRPRHRAHPAWPFSASKAGAQCLAGRRISSDGLEAERLSRCPESRPSPGRRRERRHLPMIVNRRSRGRPRARVRSRLAANIGRLERQAGDVAPRTPQTCDQAGAHRVLPTAKTTGITAVTCFTVRTARLPKVTMTSTLSRTNSAANSAARSVRPSDQRYSIATVRPSIQPRSRRCRTKAAAHGL